MATTDERLSYLEQQFATTMTKVDATLEELKQQREDIRRAQERHDADMKEMRQKHDADMKEWRAEIKSTLKHIQGLTIAAMVGIAAIAVGVLGFLWSTAQNMTHVAQPPQPPPATQYQQTEQSASR